MHIYIYIYYIHCLHNGVWRICRSACCNSCNHCRPWLLRLLLWPPTCTPSFSRNRCVMFAYHYDCYYSSYYCYINIMVHYNSLVFGTRVYPAREAYLSFNTKTATMHTSAAAVTMAASATPPGDLKLPKLLTVPGSDGTTAGKLVVAADDWTTAVDVDVVDDARVEPDVDG